MEPKVISIRAMSPEQIEQFERDVRDAEECQAHFGKVHECTEEEISYLRENHGPCPLEGPHTEDSNMLECMVALARKQKGQAT